MTTATYIYVLAGLAFGIALVGAVVHLWRRLGELDEEHPLVRLFDPMPYQEGYE